MQELVADGTLVVTEETSFADFSAVLDAAGGKAADVPAPHRCERPRPPRCKLPLPTSVGALWAGTLRLTLCRGGGGAGGLRSRRITVFSSSEHLGWLYRGIPIGQ